MKMKYCIVFSLEEGMRGRIEQERDRFQWTPAGYRWWLKSLNAWTLSILVITYEVDATSFSSDVEVRITKSDTLRDTGVVIFDTSAHSMSCPDLPERFSLSIVGWRIKKDIDIIVSYHKRIQGCSWPQRRPWPHLSDFPFGLASSCTQVPSWDKWRKSIGPDSSKLASS